MQNPKRLSEVIAELQQLLEEQGDLPVCVHDFNGTGGKVPPKFSPVKITRYVKGERVGLWGYDPMVDYPVGIVKEEDHERETIKAIFVSAQR